MIRFCDFIDNMSRVLSNTVSLLFVPLTLIAVFEVVMRYFFDSPTTWAWDVNVQLFSLIVVFGAAGTFLNHGHVSMDIIVTRFGPKTRNVISLFLMVFLIVVVGIVAWQAGIFAWRSIEIDEHTSTLLAAPIYPLKTAIFLGVVLLWLEVVSAFIRGLLTLRSGEGKSI